MAQTRYERSGVFNGFSIILVKNESGESLPNILYIHSHDTGRIVLIVQPYGHQVPTPNIQLLADQGVLFREAFCAAPTCSGSRASLLTGEYCHQNGMFGLAHRGWKLNDYSKHWVHTLRKAGYQSTMLGEQHIATDPDVIGYDECSRSTPPAPARWRR